MATIVIDPGHGGRDGGSYGKYSNESVLMLKIALAMKPLLEKSGHKVLLTRSTDTYLTLTQRAQFANRNKADIFVSLHNNSATNNTAHGFETFIFNGSVSQRTLNLQKHIHDTLVKGTGLRDRGKKRANFGVLRESHMPAVLIEYAFINNPTEENFLNGNINKLAQLTVDGINSFYGIKTSAPKPTPTPSKPTVSNNLPNTQMKDIEKAFETAYNQGDFSVNHVPKLKEMSREQVENLLISLLTRDYNNRKGGK